MTARNDAVRRAARLHPLVAAAAVAIILMFTVAASAVLGWLPGTKADATHEAAQSGQGDPAQANRAPVDTQAPGASAENYGAPPPQASQAPRAAAQCNTCGVVQGSRSVQVAVQDQSDHLIGTIAGGVTGGVVGNQFGEGNGKSALTVLGAVGGALAGREIERNIRQQQTVTHYELTVRMSDGSTRRFRSAQPFAYAAGAAVRVENDQLLPG